MFRTMFNKHEKKCSCCGSGTKIEYQLRVCGTEMKAEPVGKSNLYDYIQSHADSVDIHKILERCALMDDYSYLNRMPAEFMDTTEMPSNLAEAFARVQDAHNYFDSLPVDVKNEFDNNYLDFITSLGKPKFTAVVEKFLKDKKLDVPSEKEVKENGES